MTSDNTSEDLRAILDGRPHDASAASYFNERSPQCECENAEPCPGGHGPVQRGELLSYYLTHPQQTQLRVKDPKQIDKLKAKGINFFYKAQIFDAAFGGGMSVMREGHATDREACIQAKKITERLKEQLPEEGGILGILQFPAEAAFGVHCEKGCRQYCVYDTPIEPGDENEVMSHGDIFATANSMNFQEFRAQRSSVRVKLYDAVVKDYKELGAAEYRNGIFEPYLAKFEA
ncbi:hypothetical protein [Arenibacterium sp. LLYu02]|uniref:hypothetical protein n=1 Tax=Arenibacterium sp. LLYu02 TaxID=3404132 RepID=UPI003B223032